MKRISILAFALLILNNVYGQETQDKQKVAVYVTGGGSAEINKVIGTNLVAAITRNGNYSAVEQSAKFYAEIQKEKGEFTDGNAEDGQLSKLGKQFDAQLVCVAEISQVLGESFVSSRLVDAETAIVVAAAAGRSNLETLDDLVKTAEDIVVQLIGDVDDPYKGGTKLGDKRNGQIYNPDGIEMVYVEGFGSGIISMPGFYIGKYEVTQVLWEAVMDNNPSNFKDDNHPIENVSWDDVKAFISKLNSMTGRTYRLPTEREWLYAANEGNRKSTFRYAGSNVIGDVAWYNINGEQTTHPVGMKNPNALGIYDMSGNVWEWCESCFDTTCTTRVFRGGSWYNDAQFCRVTYRYKFPADRRDTNLGFRLALSN
ncbi:hypothetical protein FACS1894199_18160 [Bacteroidia bacterium]|nr:hypothetical protein FACS1894199_18160 [Bacteroidia bacterium]